MKVPFLCSFLLGSMLVTQVAYSADWVLRKDRYGIRVYTKKSSKQNLGHIDDSKAEMLIQAPLNKVLQAIKDVQSFTRWVPRSIEAKMLKKINDNEFYYYLQTDAPWPLIDRDFIGYLQVYKDKKSKNVKVRVSSVPNFMDKKERFIRIPNLVSIWTLQQQGDNTVLVTNECSLNPGGKIPEWVINMVSVEEPYINFLNLKRFILEKK